ncbi:MAG: hypothetical protein AABZ53_09430 [Planctomycetota bacterium]
MSRLWNGVAFGAWGIVLRGRFGIDADVLEIAADVWRVDAAGEREDLGRRQLRGDGGSGGGSFGRGGKVGVVGRVGRRKRDSVREALQLWGELIDGRLGSRDGKRGGGKRGGGGAGFGAGLVGARFAGARVEGAAAEDVCEADCGAEALARVGGGVDDLDEGFAARDDGPQVVLLREEAGCGSFLDGWSGVEDGEELFAREIKAGAESADVALEINESIEKVGKGMDWGSARIALRIGGDDGRNAVHRQHNSWVENCSQGIGEVGGNCGD